ncbi:putative Cytochrome P450 [Seiridium cardinale]
MTTLSMGPKTWVLLNTDRVVNEIIAKRASVTNERPQFPIAGELVSRNNRFVLQKANVWKEPRYLMHQYIMGPSAKEHQHIIETASLGLLKLYLNDPTTWYAHHYRYAITIMSKIVINEVLPKSQTELDDLQKVTSTFLSSINSSFAEFFPQLNWLPESCQTWRRHWKEMGNFHYDTIKTWWTDMRPRAELSAKPSFVRDVVLEKFSGTEEQSMYLTMSVMAAGADNPRMAMNAWVMACIVSPSAMQRARQELDLIYGTDDLHLPSLNDLSKLPYMCAVVKEVLRWRPVVPLMPQRVLVEDLEFEGFRFPAGTEFLVNSVPVCSNGYSRPGEFRPERWLGEDDEGEAGEKATVKQDLWHFAFNAGRRSCVGYKLAQKILFVTFARLLYCFDFSLKDDQDVTRLNPFGLGEPFPVKITVRSKAHAQLIIDELAASEGVQK